MSDFHILHDFIRAQKKKFSYMEKSDTIERKLRNKIEECIIVVSYICFFDRIHLFCLLSLMIFFHANCFVLLLKNNVFLTRAFKQNLLLFHSILQSFRLNINYDGYQLLLVSKECFVNIFQFLTRFTTMEIKLTTADLFFIGYMKV